VYQFIINSYRELTGMNNHKNINRLSIIDIEDIKFKNSERKLIEENVKK